MFQATSIFTDKPASLLEVRLHDASCSPVLRGLCCGYQSDQFRNEQFARWLFEYLPDFALRFSELGPKGHHLWVERLRRAALNVYTTDKFKARGEFGELILHAVCRDIYDSEPAVCKLYYKDGPNETVKGFDAVHATIDPSAGLELLLGEVKFYKSIDHAMTDVAKELRDHFDNDEWLKNEFLAVTRKIDDRWPHAETLRNLLHENTSLDQIIDRVRVPVLLTYESAVVAAHKKVTHEYAQLFVAEVRKLHGQFANRKLPKRVVIDLILVPLSKKADLVNVLNERLRAWQTI
jgi:hypothetical protein